MNHYNVIRVFAGVPFPKPVKLCPVHVLYYPKCGLCCHVVCMPFECNVIIWFGMKPKSKNVVAIHRMLCVDYSLPSVDDPIEHGTQYLRQCESASYAQNVIRKSLNIRGTHDISFNNILCDYDGSYGVYYIQNGMSVLFSMNLLNCIRF